VLASQKNRYQLRKLGGSNVPVSEVVRLWLNYHPVTMVRLWLAANREALALAEHPRFSIVRYEDLVQSAPATVSELCSRIGLDYRPAMLDIPHWGSSTTQHTSASGLSAAALGKWQKILDPAEIRYCTDKTRAERLRFDYPDVPIVPGIADRFRFLARLPVHVAGTMLANPRRAAVQLKALFARGRDRNQRTRVEDASVS
jgi:hypothetical protein